MFLCIFCGSESESVTTLSYFDVKNTCHVWSRPVRLRSPPVVTCGNGEAT